MGTIITKHAVNWIDGMKVSSQNFVDQENHVYDVIRDTRAIALTKWNYGVMPSNNANSSIKVGMIDGKLILYRCRGLTEGGNRVELVEETSASNIIYDLAELNTKHHLHGGVRMKFVVVVKIDPFKRVPCEDINAQEQPPRHPWAFPFYQLDVMKEEQFNHLTAFTYLLPVAKLTWQNDKFVLHERFIPPCVSINALPRLKDKFENYRSILSQMYNSSVKIVKKIKNEGHSNAFNSNIFLFTIDIGQYLGSSFDDFNLIYASKPPIYLLTYFARLVRVVELSLVRLVKEEQIRNYISDNSGITPGELRQRMSNVVKLHYNHMEIIEMLDTIDRFLNPMAEVFKKLDDANMQNVFNS